MFDLPCAVGHPDASILHEDAGWTDYGASCFGTETRRSKRRVCRNEDRFNRTVWQRLRLQATLNDPPPLLRRADTQSRASFGIRGDFWLAARLCEPTEGWNMQFLVETMEFPLGQGDSSRPPHKARLMPLLASRIPRRISIYPRRGQ
jgi:hypothetical protein